MKAPNFWYKKNGSICGWMLAPFGSLYGAATAKRLRSRTPIDPGLPVVCIGNLTAGGAGKTPVVLDLAKRLVGFDHAAHVISKGYGARDRNSATEAATRVDPAVHSVDQVGDEPLMMAMQIPVWVAMDRATAATTAMSAGAEVLILDDGFQDPSLAKTKSLVVVDGKYGFGNGRLIPAGPLRESLRAGLVRADAVVIIGEDQWGAAAAVHACRGKDFPIFGCRVVPGPEVTRLAGQLVFAFAGIGHPDKFFRTLEEGGCTVVGQLEFADHHQYTTTEVTNMKSCAETLGAILVTTEKDRARLSPVDAQGIETLTITLEWDDEAALDRLLHAVVS